jgi:hypothetical protein
MHLREDEKTPQSPKHHLPFSSASQSFSGIFEHSLGKMLLPAFFIAQFSRTLLDLPQPLFVAKILLSSVSSTALLSACRSCEHYSS